MAKQTTRQDAPEAPEPNEQQVANAEQAAKVEELSDPSMLAEVDSPKAVKVKSPTGAVTEVPESLVDVLVDSGYSKTK